MDKKERIKELKIKIAKLNKEIDEELYAMEGPPEEEEIQPEPPRGLIEVLSSELYELERELLDLEYSEEEVIRRNEINQLIHQDGYIIRDSESVEDYLSRKEQAKEISKLISSKKTLSPLTLGIYGKWGEGKSSFLRLIEGELKIINTKIKNDKSAENQYSKTHFVRFNASEYNDQDKIWFSMLNQLFSEYEK
ncbi:hypothetical protein KIS1582_5079, partial [Cytobacillus firmus]